MGAKRFGAALVTPAVNTLVMTASVGTDSVVVLHVANQGSLATKINVAYMPGNVVSAISNEDYIVFNKEVAAGDFLQVKGIAVEAGYSIVVSSDVSTVSAVAYGMESPSV